MRSVGGIKLVRVLLTQLGTSVQESLNNCVGLQKVIRRKPQRSETKITKGFYNIFRIPWILTQPDIDILCKARISVESDGKPSDYQITNFILV
jgi:hypothetical protein